jgi:hypothetical protein
MLAWGPAAIRGICLASYRDVPLSDMEIERRILYLRLAAELAAIPTIYAPSGKSQNLPQVDAG